MGYLEEITSKDSTISSFAWCKRECQYLMWIFHNLFSFDEDQPILYQSKFTDIQWRTIVGDAFPKNVPPSKVTKNIPSTIKTASKKTLNLLPAKGK